MTTLPSGRRASRAPLHHFPSKSALIAAAAEQLISSLEPYRESLDSPITANIDDLAELFEGAAADGTPVREVVGDDPVEFVDAFKSNYGIGSWITKEQKRLAAAIEQAEKEETP